MKFPTSFFLIVVGVFLSILGDIFLKESAFERKGLFIAGVALYAIAAIPVALAFKRLEFGIVFLIWEAVTVILALAVASLFFKEPFTTYKALALFLALGALYFSYK